MQWCHPTVTQCLLRHITLQSHFFFLVISIGQGQSDEIDEPYGPCPGDDARTMKAFVMEAPGDISDMKLASVYIPKPPQSKIRVKAMAAGLNLVDYRRCRFTDPAPNCLALSHATLPHDMHLSSCTILHADIHNWFCNP